MQTNVWPTMKWNDYQMQWDPTEFDGIRTIRVPPDKVWLPDIVLFNNADGNYLVSFYSNVVVEHTGDMLWVPPAVYKSSCLIDVEFFPFDGNSQILPPTSSTIPLMAKYLLMTFVMNMITIMVSVIIINVYFRGPATHIMPAWVKTIFLKFLPVVFVMRRPESTEKELERMKREKRERRSMRSALKTFFRKNETRVGTSNEEKLSCDAKKAIEAIEYITTHLTHDNVFKRQREEWKFVSVVIDRLLLYLFFGVTTGGTMGILLSAPNVFEHVNQTSVIERLKQQAAEDMLNS
uniref:Neurotransmitter-gated ion-channel ligand-binding domain-containing protein n=1 Tax=Caenorhabditis japonica TaxID=281687 RepID=A0A8R1E163_CAEJA